jgi:transcriptional regulator GlxA family with amidase domain
LDVTGPFQVFARAAELFRAKNPSQASPYDLQIVTTDNQLLSTNCGLRLECHGSYQDVRGGIDTFLVAGGDSLESGEIAPSLVRWVREVGSKARRVGSICTGAFLLAEAGLLNGKHAVTHWKYCNMLAKKYPDVAVNPDPIFIRDTNVYTSAGVTAGMDLTLALVEEDLGSEIALGVARELVLYLRRPGGQSQFSAALELQASERRPLRDLGVWVLDNLRKDLSVDSLARHVAMSPRNFARVFTAEFNTTPAKFVEALRVEAARRRLEESAAGLEQIAFDCGFKNADAMRGVFRRLMKVAPRDYRGRFGGA